MRIDPSINQAPLSGVRPPLPPLVRERVADSGAEVRPAESFVATQATAASAVPEHAPPANNGVVEQVATSLVPGGPAFQPLGQMKSGPLEPETRTLDFPAGGSPDAIMHETGHLTTDAARPVMGGMLGALLGSYTDTADLEAALDKMRLAGDAMQRLQTLESGYTAAHMQRAGALAGQLADAAAGSAREVSINERFALAHASMIYDVGKLEVDEALLTKPGKLTDEERLAVNKQVEPSEELLGLFNPSA
ncbi:MAG: hypothetical protein FJX76_13555, partial [Armatimonadetes bacterium]|nr:hypothetical protein [Armatimonadota bacterium]